jgi:hypothetical protein
MDSIQSIQRIGSIQPRGEMLPYGYCSMKNGTDWFAKGVRGYFEGEQNCGRCMPTTLLPGVVEGAPHGKICRSFVGLAIF